ncbi:DUF4406 domain-containing protein [Pseudomonas aeruginosa]
MPARSGRSCCRDTAHLPRRAYDRPAGTQLPAFHAEAARLRSLGYQVENPAEHGEIPGFEWADYLRLDLQKLLTCQAIALLPGWMDSKGARLEFTVATNLGMRALHAEHITGPAEDAP